MTLVIYRLHKKDECMIYFKLCFFTSFMSTTRNNVFFKYDYRVSVGFLYHEQTGLST